jgi:flagella basal body P-ring formation protein FlgA
MDRMATGGGRIEARAGGIDRRVRLRQCEEDLEGFLPPGRDLSGRQTTVGVRCPGPVQWRIFVSVRLSVMVPVVVATTPLQRGAVVPESALGLAERDTGGLQRNYFTDPDRVQGMRLRQNLAPGTVLQPRHLEIHRLVRRGQRLRLIARSDSVQVSMAGKALEDGARGQRIRVENLSSGKELEGVVTDEATVEIRF